MSDDDELRDAEPAPIVMRRRGRRVTTGDVDAAQQAPDPEPVHAEHENDDRLRGDKPPHWG